MMKSSLFFYLIANGSPVATEEHSHVAVDAGGKAARTGEHLMRKANAHESIPMQPDEFDVNDLEAKSDSGNLLEEENLEDLQIQAETCYAGSQNKGLGQGLCQCKPDTGTADQQYWQGQSQFLYTSAGVTKRKCAQKCDQCPGCNGFVDQQQGTTGRCKFKPQGTTTDCPAPCQQAPKIAFSKQSDTPTCLNR
eukprot:gnl/MRDRNA2_/MRDRNA2_105420_c0_seq1.p1 gnl/MRDRNA2_/MRDRNA2_105420_c0~~gnl/MRDRNA2_/MRDRNA2_105420_c0_seq1.p1  ORF type:complete len:193 (+),score=40.51 gnl/MRDRNA2_/MRDRNA2_105420_c0_seq1:100-678(+)